MKMRPEHLQYLKAAIEPIMQQIPVSQYREANPTFSAKRVRWDYLWAAKLSPWVCAHLYPYLTDDHIDTALRHIVGV